ncbi:multidrug effflux MFS transporter [Acidocella sp.]|jgi:DHA1 family bicyclomycin/chloramphenicol resistance-like MFS transporter|uniref:multidrug effflux MFS transporter n=1 Tax=Acidocella sp. TaxID=50710 RepID=UPI002F3E6ECC
MRLRRESFGLLLFLGALAALPPLAIDMSLPAMPVIARALHAASSMVGLTLSLFMAGFAVSPVVYGPLADRYGRRLPLLAGLLLFTLGGLAAMAAPTIALLLTARLVQGVGAGAGMTLAFTIVRDLFEGRAAQTRLAVITIVANVAPIVAPALGALLLGMAGWRGIYGVPGLSGVLLTVIAAVSLPETRPGAAPPAGVRRLVGQYRQVLCHREVMLHIGLNALGFGWMFAYVSGSSLVLIGLMHVSAALYAGLFACTGMGIVVGAFCNARLSHRGVSATLLLSLAVALALTATLTLCWRAALGPVPLGEMMPLLVLATASFGLAAPSAAHGALHPLPDCAGIVGGLLTSLQMLGGAGASGVVALLFPRFGLMAMAGTMAGCAVAALGLRLLLAARTREGRERLLFVNKK